MAAKRLRFEQLSRMAAVLATVLAVGARSDLASAVVYTNVTSTAGIAYKQRLSGVAPFPLHQTGGAAAADYNNDGWVDLFVTKLDGAPVLYRNTGSGTFENVSQAAGFTAGLPLNGAAFGDIDNDGDKDLYVTSSGQSGAAATRFYLYINDGNGHFAEEAVARGAAVSGVFRVGMSVTYGDYDSDGYLDIHTTDWGNDIADSTSRLLRNLGAANPGYFEDVTVAAGLNVYRPSYFPGGSTDGAAYRFASTFTDLDRDGHPDLAITGDFKTSQIFWNNGNGTFTDGTAAAGVGADEDGMGQSIGDYDGDGRMDWFISALVDVPGNPPHAGNFLYKNNGNRTFTDATPPSLRNSGWSWGTTFLDQDNDRDLDIFVTNGGDPNLPDQSHVYENSGGAFTDVSNSVGVTDNKLGRGLLSFDYDNDGDLDVFIANHGNPFGGSLSSSILYRNDGGNANDWLKIKVQGTTSNRDGLGTFITVDPDTSVTGDEMVREINAGSNFVGQNELTAHVGLGPNSGTIDLISVVWPSGAVQQLSNVSPNQVLNLVESAGLLGDYNQNLVVDAADYAVWRDQLGSMGSGYAADGNGDNMVNQLDYDLWKANFGTMAVGAASAAQLAPVPEPSTVALLVVGAFIHFLKSTADRDHKQIKRILIVAGAMVSVWAPSLSADEPSNVAKPIPATRPEMKTALEALKVRQPRIPPPRPTEGEATDENDRTPGDYLPAMWGLGGFGQYNVRGARNRIGQVSGAKSDRLFADSSFWVVSRGNNCHYCLGHQELKLRYAGMDDDTIATLDSDWSQFDPRQQAALAYARRLTLEPQLVDDQEIAALKKLFTDADIIEMTYNIAQFNSANRWTDGIGLPQERYFTDEGERTLMTPTSERFQNTVSIVTPPTRAARPQPPTVDEVNQTFADCCEQTPRVQLPSEEKAREVLASVIGDRPLLNWERAMAGLPGTGPAQVAALNAIMTDEHLPLRLKAEISLISAANNRAWYALGHAIHRLRGFGVTTGEIAALLRPQPSVDADPAHRLAAKSTVNPHLITDADIASVREKYSDAETAQIMQVICMANMFDRFTESLGLPLEERICR